MENRDDASTVPRLGEPTPASDRAADISDPDAELVAYSLGDRYAQGLMLGKGGMGEVRLCRDRAIGREVAMKVVQGAYATDREIRERFVREARVQAQLEHPAIVPVYDFGIDAEGHAYFTMKRVRGVTLEEIVERLRQRDPEMTRMYSRHRLLAAFVQVCRAIDYAHERGVLHRDLKPANVMLGPYGEVYVLDWGIARVRSASRDLDGSLGASRIDVAHDETAGAVLGTPQYMAPEQLRGEPLDERTDVYGLGEILFELLSLEPLHRHGLISARMSRDARSVDARPEVRNPESAVPPELSVTCVHACAHERDRRFASARELAEAVEAYLSGDRDVELRRELSAVHLERAREAASRALVPGAAPDERRTALAEAGRAVAFSPDDVRSRAVLVELLTRPPTSAPPEVLAAMEAEARDSHLKMLPRAALSLFLPWFLVVPGIAVLGIRDLTLVALAMFLYWGGAAHALVTHMTRRSNRNSQRRFTILMAAALAACSVFVGPLVLTPFLATTFAIAMVLHLRAENRVFVIGSMAFAVIVPTLLALFDVHPVKYAAGPSGALAIFPAAMDLPPTLTLVAMAVLHVTVIIAGGLYAVTFRKTMDALSLANRLQSWQLSHLVPEETAAAMSRPPPAMAATP